MLLNEYTIIKLTDVIHGPCHRPRHWLWQNSQGRCTMLSVLHNIIFTIKHTPPWCNLSVWVGCLVHAINQDGPALLGSAMSWEIVKFVFQRLYVDKQNNNKGGCTQVLSLFLTLPHFPWGRDLHFGLRPLFSFRISLSQFDFKSFGWWLSWVN